MAYIPFTSAEIQVKKPNKKELWDKVKGNDDDHETRILDLEGGSTSTIPMMFPIWGEGAVDDDVARLVVTSNISINGVTLFGFHDGTSGTTEIDVQGSQSGGAYATILSGGNVILTQGGGDDNNAVASGIATTDFDAGDVLRLDVKTFQPGGRHYLVYVTYTFRG